MGWKRGADAVLTAGGIEIDNCRDLTLSLEGTEVDLSTRANGGWKATGLALKDASIEFSMIWDETDAGFAAIRDAYLDGENIETTILSSSTGQGLRAQFAITKFSRGEPVDGAQTVDVTAKVGYAPDDPPEWI